jgi:methylmalonyl-CoA mutase N-terminal domain/subunit
MEAAANEYVRIIDNMGGMISAIDRGFPQREIANASYEHQVAVERGERTIVGVNGFQEGQTRAPELFRVDQTSESRQIDRLRSLKRSRNQPAVDVALDKLRHAAEGELNTMPYILDAVRVYATVGEISAALAGVFGRYTEVPSI